MIDPHLVADQPDLVKEHLRKRHAAEELFSQVDRIVELSGVRGKLVFERDELRARRNALSKQIGGLMREGKAEEAERVKGEVADGNARIKWIEDELANVETEANTLLLGLPNLTHPSTPDGEDEDDNPTLSTWGTIRSIPNPQEHVELGTALGILDLERSAKLSGARFSILRGAGARLERALINYFLDLHTGEHGYTEVMVPYIVQEQCPLGTGQLPKFAEDMFKLEGELNGKPAYLIPTSEIPVTNIHREEILDEEALPLKYACFSPCFRSEAGSAGKDTRGIIRQHQFHKVELVWITTPDLAEAAHLELLSHAEIALRRLDLPYRVVQHCGGELSFAAHRAFDLEVWLPSQGRYREISSVSHFTDFQARRMQLRYRPQAEGGKKAKPRLAHTLNGSGLAVGRTLVAILENYQQPDGSVVVPPVLRPYMGGLEVIRAD